MLSLLESTNSLCGALLANGLYGSSETDLTACRGSLGVQR